MTSNKLKTDVESGQVLIEAVKYGNHELVKELLSTGDSVHYLDYCDDRGFTPLHFASSLNDSTCLKLLLAAGGERQQNLIKLFSQLYFFENFFCSRSERFVQT